MAQKPIRPYERPAAEPEIIPPEHSSSAWQRQDAPPGGFFGARYGQRVYVAKVGPVGLALFALLAVLLVAAILVFVIGALLVWIPVIALLVAAGIVVTGLRRYFMRSP
jgi:hypothetical protein